MSTQSTQVLAIPLGNVYRLWQHDEVHQLLRGLVNDDLLAAQFT